MKSTITTLTKRRVTRNNIQFKLSSVSRVAASAALLACETVLSSMMPAPSYAQVSLNDLQETLMGGNTTEYSVTGGSASEILLSGYLNEVNISAGEMTNLLIDDQEGTDSNGHNRNGNTGVTVDGGSLHNVYFNGGSGTLTVNSGSLSGEVEMGRASDVVSLGAGANVSQLTVLDGEGGFSTTSSQGGGGQGGGHGGGGQGGGSQGGGSNGSSAGNNAVLYSVQSLSVGATEARPDQIAGLGISYDEEDPTPSGINYDKKDTLNLNTALTGSSETAGAAGNTRIVHWDVVNIGETGRLNLTGDLHSGWEDLRLGDIGIAPGGILALNQGTAAASVRYNVVNAGTLDLTQGSAQPNGKLTIEGDYEGKAGSVLAIKTTWNDLQAQQNDTLIIKGDAAGDTMVQVRNPGTAQGSIIGDVTIAEGQKVDTWTTPVITVQGTDNGFNDNTKLTFRGTAETMNAGQAQLAKKGDDYYWTLRTIEPDPVLNPPAPNPGPSPEPDSGQPILSPSVAGYVQTPGINREMGFEMMDSLHSRVGERQTWVWDDCGAMFCDTYNRYAKQGKSAYPVWGRVGLGTLEQQGKERLGSESDTALIQLGADLSVTADDKMNHTHTGVMLSYGHADNDFYDKYRAENGVVSDDKRTGTGKSDMLSLGAYHTWYRHNGTYVDLVGQVSWIHNEYKSREGVGAGQDGYGLGTSVEVGRPWQIGESAWLIEPFAQLSYQYVGLDSFTADDGRKVSGQDGGALRGRLGARLAWNKGNADLHTNTFYVKAAVVSDLAGAKSEAAIGRDTVEESYARTWGELGVGAQLPLGKTAYLYGDVSYELALGGYTNEIYRGSGVSREGYSGRIGIRYIW